MDRRRILVWRLRQRLYRCRAELGLTLDECNALAARLAFAAWLHETGRISG